MVSQEYPVSINTEEMVCDHPIIFQIFSQIFDNYRDIDDALPVKQWYVIIWYTSKSGYMITINTFILWQ
jgi:hypothetical protein